QRVAPGLELDGAREPLELHRHLALAGVGGVDARRRRVALRGEERTGDGRRDAQLLVADQLVVAGAAEKHIVAAREGDLADEALEFDEFLAEEVAAEIGAAARGGQDR